MFLQKPQTKPWLKQDWIPEVMQIQTGEASPLIRPYCSCFLPQIAYFCHMQTNTFRKGDKYFKQPYFQDRKTLLVSTGWLIDSFEQLQLQDWRHWKQYFMNKYRSIQKYQRRSNSSRQTLADTTEATRRETGLSYLHLTFFMAGQAARWKKRERNFFFFFRNR